MHHIADDDNFLNVNTSAKPINEKVIHGLGSLAIWFIANPILVNVGKTKPILLFHLWSNLTVTGKLK